MNLDSSISILKKLNIDGNIPTFSPISFGRNSQSFKISSDEDTYLLKSFRHHPDGLERFQREKFCLNLGNRLNIQNMPRLISWDESELQILCEFIEGEQITNPSLEFEDSLINFIVLLNSNSEFLKDCLNAKDAYLDDFNIFSDISQRISLITNIVNTTYQEEFQNIIKHFQNLKRKYPVDKLITYETQLFNKFQPVFSPSDVGIHNSLAKGDRFYFFDFEYSGMDSIVKLVLDYSSNPQNSQTSVNYSFIKCLDRSNFLPNSSNFLEWLLHLRNYFLVKWSLICLSACLKNSNDLEAYFNLKLSLSAIEY